jgi:hypothetical protein
MKNSNTIWDWQSPQIVSYITSIMQHPSPHFLGRIGGNEFDAVSQYYYDNNVINDDQWYGKYSTLLKDQTGYFDFSNDRNLFKKYLEDMIVYWKDADSISIGNWKLMKRLRKNSPTPAEAAFVEYILKNKTAFPYTIFEYNEPFRKSFETWGNGKKILIISPLSKSIQHQYINRNKIFLNYNFPNFELKTYNTKITYNNHTDTKETLGVDTNNWHEELNKMISEIKQIDFDVAFLSCASYAVPLGYHIKNTMCKKSIFYGGAINLLFNIYGGRWHNAGDWDGKNYYQWCDLNLANQIDPFENADILNLKAGRQFPTESLNAYFGNRPGENI